MGVRARHECNASAPVPRVKWETVTALPSNPAHGGAMNTIEERTVSPAQMGCAMSGGGAEVDPRGAELGAHPPLCIAHRGEVGAGPFLPREPIECGEHAARD